MRIAVPWLQTGPQNGPAGQHEPSQASAAHCASLLQKAFKKDVDVAHLGLEGSQLDTYDSDFEAGEGHAKGGEASAPRAAGGRQSDRGDAEEEQGDFITLDDEEEEEVEQDGMESDDNEEEWDGDGGNTDDD